MQRLAGATLGLLRARGGAAPAAAVATAELALRARRGALPPARGLVACASHRSGRTAQLAVRAAASSSARGKQLYRCRECGETALQWSGQCMSCKAFGSLEKVTLAAAEPAGGGGGARAAARFAATHGAGFGDDDGPPPPGHGPPRGAASGGASAAGGVAARRAAWVSEVEAPQRLSDVSARSFRQTWRMALPGAAGAELGRVLGGGVVPGSLVLVGGEPGVGKSTLLLQVAGMLTGLAHPGDTAAGAPAAETLAAEAQADELAEASSSSGAAAAGADAAEPALGPVLYVSGEESAEQIGSRAERLGMGANPLVFLLSATRLDAVLDAVVRLRPRALVVDSIQTVYLDDLPSSAGSVVQARFFVV
jgi:DNA repair protein RadA/Sms